MGASQLGERLLFRLGAADGLPDLELAGDAVELAGLLLRWGVGEDAPEPSIQAVAAAELAALSALAPAFARVAIELAAEPEHRPGVDDEELEAFEARFGHGAARRLRGLADEPRDLLHWSSGHTPAACVGLVGALVRLALRRSPPGLDQPEGPSWPEALRRLEEAAQELGVDELVLTQLIARNLVIDGAVLPLQGERVAMGSGPGCQVYLPDPGVARHHCDLVQTAAGWRVIDAGSGRPTIVGGRVVGSAPLEPGAELELGPYRLSLQPGGHGLLVTAPTARQILAVRGLERRIEDLVLLDGVSFTVASGEVVAVVGPSGSGKTTLLNAITGVAPADRGTVELDGHPFHALLQVDRSRVGSVPQDDIVHPELTVQESLSASARLRLPRGSRSSEIQQAVDRVLGELDIPHIRRSRIGDAMRRGISGGQRKRVNLGQELLTRSTSILFLDEPTSGLDPRAAQDIVRLVRQLADRSRIVFLVTHDLTPQVMAQVDHLMVLVPGGRLAWFGPPEAACAYFGVATPDAIFHRLEERKPEDWSRAWLESVERRRRVASREAWFHAASSTPAALPDRSPPPGAFSHFVTLVRRYALVKARDRTGLWVLGAQPPFLALVMGLVFPKPTAEMLFMLTLSCLWFGMSAAVRELISDRAVWRRERRVGVGVLAYLGSKVAVLGLISVAQCALLSLALWQIFGMAAYGFPPAEFAALSALIGLCGMTLGLLVSAAFSSSEAAVGSLPLLLIPQISFSALLVNLRDMSAVSRALTWIDPLRYAFDAMLRVGTDIAAPTRTPGKWDTRPFTAPLYDFGFKGSSVEDLGLSMPVLTGALVAFTLTFLGTSLLIVWRRDEG